jgi:hypothetical protein
MAEKKSAERERLENVMPLPEVTHGQVAIPEVTESNMPSPEVTDQQIPVPDATPSDKPLPETGDPSNYVMFGDQRIEIKATKLKYQRDRTAAFYRILQQMPLVDVLALQDGLLDPERSSDKMLFDWLIAATDNVELVQKYYDEITTETVEDILRIFCKRNKISDKDEERKNREAQGANP